MMESMKHEEYNEDLSQYNFRKFAVTYFLKNINHQYSKRPLKESLLDLPTPDDILAAQALWITILRFMGDLSELRDNPEKKSQNVTVMNKVSETLNRSFVNRREYQVRHIFLNVFCNFL